MSRKKKTREPSAPDAAQFAAKGLDPAEPKAVLATLAKNWGAEPEFEAWVVGKVGGLDDHEVGGILHQLQDATPSKDVRREIKRALYKLEQRGHWKTPTEAPPSARDLLGPEEDAPLGWLSPIDPTGTRLVWMARRTGGGMASLSAVIDEDHGIREFHSGKTTRKALREAHREIAQRSGIGLTDAPWEWVHDLLRRAHEKTERGRHPDVPSVLKTIAPDAATAAPPPAVDSLLDRATVAADEAALTASAELLSEPEVGAWLLPLPWMEDTLGKLSDTGSSVLVVSPSAQEERVAEAFDDAISQLLDDEARRNRFADRLEESAFLLAKRGANAHARSALAAGIAAREGKPILEIPVLAEITRRSLALGLRARETKKVEEEKSSLVVTPQQAMAEDQRARRGR
ncbi:MAG: hypothetical protein P8R42_30435 [Candidatus Binatia bacterium]|nr:hypothetical protein [Candidatus Binatia bacterium]